MNERPARSDDEHTRSLGLEILESVRAATNDNSGHFLNMDDDDLFRQIYLTERKQPIPDAILNDPLSDIRAMYAQVFGGVRDGLAARLGREEQVWVYIDPWIDDATTMVMCTDHTLLLLHRSKPWNFWWPDELSMAGDLGSWYETAANRLLDERSSRQIYGTPRT
jgi:hypothetical protein